MIKSKSLRIRNIIGDSLLSVLVALISIFLFLNKNSTFLGSIQKPKFYFGDPIFYANMVQNAQHGNPLLSKTLGAPLGQQIGFTAYGFEWPQALFISAFGQNPWEAMNSYALFGFFAVAFSAFWSFRWIGIRNLPSALLAIAFNFVPEHQIYSPLLGNYFAIPITLAVVLMVITGKKLNELFELKLHAEKESFKRKINYILVFAIFFMQLFSASYYILLTGILIGSLIGLSFILDSLKKSRIDLIKLFIIQISLFAICVLPIFINRIKSGLGFSEPSIGDRRAFAAYANGADITSLFAPFNASTLYFNIVSIFKPIKLFLEEYWSSPLTGNSEYIIHPVGFATVALLLLIALKYIYDKRILKSSLDAEMHSLFIVLFILIGFYLRGGLGTLLAFFFPLIRGYGRLNIYIIFVILAIIGLFAKKVSFRYTFRALSALAFSALLAADSISAIPVVLNENTNAIQRLIPSVSRDGSTPMANGNVLSTLGPEGTKKLEAFLNNKYSKPCQIVVLPMASYPVDFRTGVTSYYSYETIKPALTNTRINWIVGGIPGTPNNREIDGTTTKYANADYSALRELLANSHVCGALFFESLQSVFYSARVDQNSGYGAPSNVHMELKRASLHLCYLNQEAQMFYYCKGKYATRI